MDVVRIGDREVGGDAPVYIIAEAGSNHDRDLDQAKRLIDVKAFKVASYELWHLPLIREIASRGKPIMCSTGMADLADVQDAVDTVAATGNDQLILLHCVVNYPPPFSDLNLRAIETLRTAFHVPVGYSDHSAGITAPVVATALGAAVIEKHFTLDRSLPGRDHRFALEPGEPRSMVQAIRVSEAALGDGVKRMAAAESDLYRT